MSPQIRIWTCAAFLPAYGCGGWASVRMAGGQTTGVAGGERHATARRIALAGLAAALRDLPPAGAGTAISIQTTSAELAEFTAVLARLGQPSQDEIPAEDLDLWAQILTASKGRRMTLTRTTSQPGAPAAFTTAWAQFARDKAKASGPFSAPIPKVNLAKFPGVS
jgi:ribonuclease HI